MSVTAVWPTQLPIQRALGTLCPLVKWLVGVGSRGLTFCDKVKNVRSFTTILLGMVLKYKSIHLQQRHFKYFHPLSG
jgi:hypothetical protein